MSGETYGFIDASLSNGSYLATGLLSSGHNIVVYLRETQSVSLTWSIPKRQRQQNSQVDAAFIEK